MDAHMNRSLSLTVMACSLLAFTASAEESVSLGDFDKDKHKWGFSLGQEFPGAQGRAELDKEQKRHGSGSLRVTADFTKGGVYVGVNRGLPNLDVGTVSFWVRSDGPRFLTLRLVDSTGQCHQINRVGLTDTSAWQEVALDVLSRVGGEHWGGANDGKWHPPARLFSINFDRGGLPPDRLTGTLWLDDVRATLRKLPVSREIKGIEQTVLLDDFETERMDWGFTRGEEFPGAQGSMQRHEVAKNGQHSLRVSADFTGGGAYVGLRRNLTSSGFRDVRALRFWLKGENARAYTISVVDGTGQCHQKKGFPIAATDDWQEVRVAIADLVGGEHWGGANDGRWHGPARQIGLSFERGWLKKREEPKAMLWLDDLEVKALLSAVSLGQVKFGNVFATDEPKCFLVKTPDKGVSKVTWGAKDFFGAVAASGEQPANAETPLTFELNRRGYFTLTATAWDEDKELDSARMTFAVLDDFDFSSVEDYRFGICAHFGQWYSPEIIPLVQRAGIKEARDDIYWGDLEREKGVFAFPDKYEGFVRKLEEAKIRAHLNLVYTNKFYNDGKAPHDEEGFAGYARYAAEVVKHFPQLRSVEVWNEWNSPGFCPGPAASKPDIYEAMIRTTYEAVKKVRPDVSVVGCSTTGLWWGGYLWLERYFQQQNSLRLMDALSFHPYHCALAPEYLTDCVAKLRGMIRESGQAAPPLWVTEVGWPVNVDPEAGAEQVYMSNQRVVTEELQAIYMVRTYVLLLAAGVERVHWYDLMNDGTNPKHGEHNFGLFRHPADALGKYAPKPAYAAYAAMTRQLAGAEFVRAEQETPLMRSYLFRRGDQELRVVWTLGAVAVRIRAGGPVTVRSLDGEPRQVAPADGEILLPLPEGVPVYLTGPVIGVSSGVCVEVPGFVRIALGETIDIPYEIQNTTGSSVEVTIDIDGKATAIAAKAGATQQAVIPLGAASQEETGTHVCRVALNQVTLDTRKVTVAVEAPITVAEPPCFVRAQEIRTVVRNASRKKPYQLSGIDWEIGDQKGRANVAKTLTPDSTQELLVPGALPPPFTARPLMLRLGLGGIGPVVYRGIIANNPCQKKAIRVDGNLDEWKEIPAIDLARDGRVELKGHKGPSDLGGQVRIAYDEGNFYLSAEITDDTHFQPYAEEATWQGDGVQFAVAENLPWNSTGYYEVNVALTAKGPDVYLVHSARGERTGRLSSAVCRIVREGSVTRYELAIPLRDVALIDPAKTQAFGFSMLVNDNDGKGRKGWIEWGSGIGRGKYPAKFRACRVSR